MTKTMTKTLIRSVLMLAATLLAGASWAQPLPSVTTSTQSYAPLVGATPITWSGTGDDQGIVVPLGFIFPFLGTNYTHVVINTNGLLVLGTSASVSTCISGCNGNAAFPDSASPNGGLIAGWWEDLHPGNGGTVRYLSGSGTFAVEWSGVPRYSNSGQVTFLVRLDASGTVVMHYGSITTGVTAFSASVGFENSTGTVGMNLLPCMDTCSGADFVPDRLIRIGEPQLADLFVPSVAVSNLTRLGDGNLTFDVNGTIRNGGKTAANNFDFKAYLSTGRQLDAGTLIQIGAGGPYSLLGVDGGFAADGGPSLVNVTAAAATTTPPPPGEFYVLIEANADRTLTEATYENNIGSTATAFVQGSDPIAISISGPDAGTGNLSVTLPISTQNRGTVAPSGPVPFRVVLSLDQTIDGSDFTAYSDTRTYTAGQNITENLTFTLPANTPAGDFYWGIELNSGSGAVTEATAANNTAVSANKVIITRADLVAESLTVLDTLTGLPTAQGKLGEATQFKVVFKNASPVPTGSFKLGIFLSTDASLSLLGDSFVCDQTVATLAANAPSTTVTIDCNLPLVDRNNQPLSTGVYYLFFVVDSQTQVPETNEANNTQLAGPLRFTAPGADLSVSSVTAPASAGVGETIPVVRTLRNLGNVDAGSVPYRFYASANDIITQDDELLPIVGAGGMVVSEGSIALAHGEANSATELVRIPNTLPAGTYYVGCIIDPDANTLGELDRTNNALASRTMVVAASALRVANSAVPDAVIGRPYSYRLSALGASGAVTWAIDRTLGDAPTWLSIGATDGVLSGTPTSAVAEVLGFTVRIDAGGRQAVARLALRVMPTTSSLEIISASLPAVVNSSGVQYAYTLGAAGGVGPYTWRIVTGTLPAGLSLSSVGVLAGAPQRTQNGTTPITVEVIDNVGGRAQKQFTVRLIAPGAITFRTLSIRDAIVGQEYLEDIAVGSQDTAVPLATPLVWRVTGDVPVGITVTPQSEVITLGGRPTQAGTFTFTITVEDANGRSDALEFTMTVHAPRYKVLATMPDAIRAGDAVNIPLSVSPVGAVTYRLVNGTLPTGLTLDPSGSISGTVGNDVRLGAWPFIIEARDASSINGFSPLSINIEAPVKSMGCSTTGGFSPVLFALFGLLFFGRRGKRSAMTAAAVGAAVLLMPTLARAQAINYQVVGPVSATYVSLGTAPYTNPASTTAGASITMPFATPFFDAALTSVAMSQYGYLAVNGALVTDSSNEQIPDNSSTSSSSANTIIAPWWDSLSAPSGSNGYRYLVTGQAPNRVMIFEWAGVGANAAASRVNFQVHVYEGTGHVRFMYGSAFPATSGVSASVGIQKQDGTTATGVAGLTCTNTSSCASANFPAGQAIDFYLPADLEITTLSSPQTGYTGVAIPLTATVRNTGGRDVTNVPVAFYVSVDATLTIGSDTLIGTGTVASIGVNGTGQASLNSLLPSSLTGSSYYLFAVVDPNDTIPERSKANNTSRPSPLAIGAPSADLVVTTLTSPTSAAPGAMVTLARTIQNAGNAPSLAAKYTYFLSDNASVSIADRSLLVGNVGALTAGQNDMAMESVAIPVDLAPGSYWLGVCVNYDGATGQFGGNEITIVNNCFTQTAILTVATTSVTISSDMLPMATRYAPFGVRLQAAGGTGTYSWEAVTPASLPAGLTLSANGDLLGAPSNAGNFSFEVKVTSGALTDTRSLTLAVQEGGLPLTVVDQTLSSAEFGKAYGVNLIAVGGTSPYQWAAVDAEKLPVGLGVAHDGLIEGRPQAIGDFAFEVQVTDAAGAMSSRKLTMHVGNPTSLSAATGAIALGSVGREYLQPLVAVGGTAPYAWTLLRFQQLPQTITDVPGPVLERGTTAVDPWPADFGLSIDDRDTADYLSGTPLKAGLFALTFKVTDGNGIEDTASVLLTISYRDGLAITTLQLPDAFVSQPYQIKLSHNGGSDAVGIGFSVPCIEQAVRPGEFTCATMTPSEALPAGLTLAADGTIIGTPTSEAGTYTFLVRVADASGRQDVRALSLRVRSDAVTQTQGCSSVPFEPMLMLVLTGLAMRRRRR